MFSQCKGCNEETDQIVGSQNMAFCKKLAYFLKDKAIKEVASEMDILTNSSTQEIIRQNRCQMRFIETFYWKNVD